MAEDIPEQLSFDDPDPEVIVSEEGSRGRELIADAFEILKALVERAKNSEGKDPTLEAPIPDNPETSRQEYIRGAGNWATRRHLLIETMHRDIPKLKAGFPKPKDYPEDRIPRLRVINDPEEITLAALQLYADKHDGAKPKFSNPKKTA